MGGEISHYVAGAQYCINNYTTTKNCYMVRLPINRPIESLLILTVPWGWSNASKRSVLAQYKQGGESRKLHELGYQSSLLHYATERQKET